VQRLQRAGPAALLELLRRLPSPPGKEERQGEGESPLARNVRRSPPGWPARWPSGRRIHSFCSVGPRKWNRPAASTPGLMPGLIAISP